jgi:predicted nucleic acid-binding protein
MKPKKARRAGATETFSVSVDPRTKKALRALADRDFGGNQALVPLPVVSEWWRGRTDAREAILAAVEVVASVEIAKAAGVALATGKGLDATLTIDAIVMATAWARDATVVTGDPDDFERLAPHFPGVPVIST